MFLGWFQVITKTINLCYWSDVVCHSFVQYRCSFLTRVSSAESPQLFWFWKNLRRTNIKMFWFGDLYSKSFITLRFAKSNLFLFLPWLNLGSQTCVLYLHFILMCWNYRPIQSNKNIYTGIFYWIKIYYLQCFSFNRLHTLFKHISLLIYVYIFKSTS